MKFTRDNSKVRSFSAGGIKETDAYICTINKAYVRKSESSLSEAIHLDLTTDKGQFASIDLWYQGKQGTSTDKNGKDLPAVTQINDIMVLLDLPELTQKNGMVAVYDYELRQEIEQKKVIFPDLIGQEIGCIFEMVTAPHYKTGEDITRPEFRQFFHSETQQSAAEFLNDQEPQQIERYLNLLLEDKHIIKQAINQPNATVKDAIPMDYIEDDDIPFN